MWGCWDGLPRTPSGGEDIFPQLFGKAPTFSPQLSAVSGSPAWRPQPCPWFSFPGLIDPGRECKGLRIRNPPPCWLRPRSSASSPPQSCFFSPLPCFPWGSQECSLTNSHSGAPLPGNPTCACHKQPVRRREAWEGEEEPWRDTWADTAASTHLPAPLLVSWYLTWPILLDMTSTFQPCLHAWVQTSRFHTLIKQGVDYIAFPFIRVSVFFFFFNLFILIGG